MTKKLPDAFADRLIKQIGSKNFDRYLDCMDRKAFSGIRVNTLKLSPEEFERISPFKIRRIPWITNGYYYDDDEKPSKNPYYFAGLYYIQDPSAMTPASLLPVKPGDRVLDLCAAPGGKTTELGAKLKNKGVLVANDISKSRAKALLKNIELFGITDAVVTAETPERLSSRFNGYFDRILVDAPCSGEGMFRKSPVIMDNWEHYGTEYYSKLQVEILDSAVKMLRPGGYLLYSTCTFSPLEDEGSVMHVLNNNDDMHVVKAIGEKSVNSSSSADYSGFSSGHPDWVENGSEELNNCIRLWPFNVDGEGHFAALMKKDVGSENIKEGDIQESNIVKELDLKSVYLNLSHVNSDNDKRQVKNSIKNNVKQDHGRGLGRKSGFTDENKRDEHHEYINYPPKGLPDLSGLCVMRNGFFAGESINGRFEPSQALACAMHCGDLDSILKLPYSDPRVERYLKCETIEGECSDGYVLVCVDNYPLGFGKAKAGIIKNKYLPGWRLM